MIPALVVPPVATTPMTSPPRGWPSSAARRPRPVSRWSSQGTSRASTPRTRSALPTEEWASSLMAINGRSGARSPMPVAGRVPGHHQRRQVSGRATRDEAPAGPVGEPGQVGQDAERLVFGGHRPGRLHPRGALEGRAGHDHVEEEGGLGRRGRDEGEEAGAVARHHRGGQFVVEDLHDPAGVGAVRVDQPVQAVRPASEAWAPPKSSGTGSRASLQRQ